MVDLTCDTQPDEVGHLIYQVGLVVEAEEMEPHVLVGETCHR